MPVYSLNVWHELEVWPEMNMRRRRWMSLPEAIQYIDDPDLRRTLKAFARSIGTGPIGGPAALTYLTTQSRGILMADDNNDLIELTADITSAYLGNNSTAAGDVPTIIQTIHAALVKLREPAVEETKPEPAVPVRSSIKHDYIVCLEDGAKLKMLKRYLRTHYDMTPEDYRKKWDLPRDYPMVAPAYVEARRGLALSTGLGRKKVAEAVENIKTSASEALDAARERISGSETPKPKARRTPKPKTVSAESAS